MRRKPAVATARNPLPVYVLLLNRINSHSVGTNLLRALQCSIQSVHEQERSCDGAGKSSIPGEPADQSVGQREDFGKLPARSRVDSTAWGRKAIVIGGRLGAPCID
jgi:hypothetical protein